MATEDYMNDIPVNVRDSVWNKPAAQPEAAQVKHVPGNIQVHDYAAPAQVAANVCEHCNATGKHYCEYLEEIVPATPAAPQMEDRFCGCSANLPYMHFTHELSCRNYVAPPKVPAATQIPATDMQTQVDDGKNGLTGYCERGWHKSCPKNGCGCMCHQITTLQAALAAVTKERDNQYEFNAGQIVKQAELEQQRAAERSEMLDRIVESLIARAEGRNECGDIRVMEAVDKIVAAERVASANKDKEVLAVLEGMPGAIRVSEGAGPENIYASLAVSVAAATRRLAAERERTLEEAAKKLEFEKVADDGSDVVRDYNDAVSDCIAAIRALSRPATTTEPPTEDYHDLVCTADPKDHHTIHGSHFGNGDGTYWCEVHMRQWLIKRVVELEDTLLLAGAYVGSGYESINKALDQENTVVKPELDKIRFR